MRKSIVTLMLSSFVLALGVAFADTIRFTDGRKPQGNLSVTNETLEKVEYTRKPLRQAQWYPASKISEVEYSDLPRQFENAQDKLEVLDFADAAQSFKLAAIDSKRKLGLAAKCLFLAGEAYRVGGMTDEAVATFDDLVQAQPTSRYVPQASLQRGLALAQGGDARRARTAFEKLRSDASSKGYGERWVFEADLQIAILDEADDPDAALDVYQRLAIATEAAHPSVANQAKLRIGRVYVATGQFDRAKEFFRTILENRSGSSSDREITAGAFNGLGSALRNDKGATEEDLKQALFHHLRVLVTYTDVLNEQAEALYSAGKCFQQVPGADSLNRSRMLLHRCIKEHPDSKWAQEAQKG